MNVKEYLRQPYELNEQINRKIELLETMKFALTNANTQQKENDAYKQKYDLMPAFVEGLEKIQALEEQINEDVDRYVKAQKEVSATIKTLWAEDEKRVLKLRYLDFLKWEEIALVMGCSLRHVHRIHVSALANVNFL